MAESFSQFINRLVGIGNNNESIIVNKVSPLENKYSLREPNNEEINALEEFYNNSKFFLEKLKKVQMEYGLEKLEAMGLALWISNEYSGMNALLYNEDIDYNNLNTNQKKFVAANYYANKALKSGKVPKYTREDMVDLATSKSYTEHLNTGNILYRGLEMGGKAKDKLIYFYQENLGKEIIDKTFFATSALIPDRLYFTEDADFLFKIKPKESSSGLMVDAGKNSLFEAEVLFSPGTAFKVESIDTNVTTINYLLPVEKLDEIFNSSPINKTIQEYIPDKNIYKSLQLLSTIAFLTFDFNAQGITAIKFIKDRYPFLSDTQIQELLDIRSNLVKLDEKNYRYIEQKGGIHILEKYTINLEEI
jgi:hypothetical protein